MLTAMQSVERIMKGVSCAFVIRVCCVQTMTGSNSKLSRVFPVIFSDFAEFLLENWLMS